MKACKCWLVALCMPGLRIASKRKAKESNYQQVDCLRCLDGGQWHGFHTATLLSIQPGLLNTTRLINAAQQRLASAREQHNVSASLWWCAD
jgi:hypothetical protein